MYVCVQLMPFISMLKCTLKYNYLQLIHVHYCWIQCTARILIKQHTQLCFYSVCYYKNGINIFYLAWKLQVCCELFVALSIPLEEKASLTAPFEVNICRARCLKGLISILPENLYNKLVSTLLSAVETKIASDPLPHAQVCYNVCINFYLIFGHQCTKWNW